MHFDLLGFDLDGVIADSQRPAFRAAAGIGAIFGMPVTVASMTDYRQMFADLEHRFAPEPNAREALRVLHRLAMRAAASGIPIFHGVPQLLPRLRVPVHVISSAMRGTVQTVLARAGVGDVPVLAHEDGSKRENLARWSAGRCALYVTDNINDIKHCRVHGIAVAAVAWGYDDPRDLMAAEPDWFVSTLDELEHLLFTLLCLGDHHD